jgi:hypothetical protein
LRYDDRSHESAVLPLTGTVPAESYPISQTISGSGPVSYVGGCGNAQGTVEALAAEWDVDSGVDASLKALFTSGTKRSIATERFLRIKVRSIATAGTCGGSIVGKDSFRLVADGTPLGPINSSLNTLLKNGEGAELLVGFAVPKAVKVLEFEVGVAGGTLVKIPMTPPTLP